MSPGRGVVPGGLAEVRRGFLVRPCYLALPSGRGLLWVGLKFFSLSSCLPWGGAGASLQGVVMLSLRPKASPMGSNSDTLLPFSPLGRFILMGLLTTGLYPLLDSCFFSAGASPVEWSRWGWSKIAECCLLHPLYLGAGGGHG